ncbi:hypothetical protein AVEN_181039-1 [Araneus ventricosus]|uniref:Uncharacterized protein n=1 Tax=Araneus ventricosus TaxID=182803 RepID=A0A4Y2X706_ARAVE|nr:hypothetical protein AVEN_181039-1 [Araneus ventricosus]
MNERHLGGACSSLEPLPTVDYTWSRKESKLCRSKMSPEFLVWSVEEVGGTNQEPGSRRGGEAKVDVESQSGTRSAWLKSLLLYFFNRK